MQFEWDEVKNKKNVLKHGITFEEAARVFIDPNIVITPDPFEGEDRWDALGLVSSVLFVVYTERVNDTIRIISARKASKEEIDGYKKGYLGRY